MASSALSFLDSLPKPKNAPVPGDAAAVPSAVAAGSGDAGTAAGPVIPPYGRRLKERYRPRAEADFGDGGAFPELPFAQYPLGMGRRGGKKAAGAAKVDNAAALQGITAPLALGAKGGIANSSNNAPATLALPAPGSSSTSSSTSSSSSSSSSVSMALATAAAGSGALVAAGGAGSSARGLVVDPSMREAAEEATARETELALLKTSRNRAKLRGDDPHLSLRDQGSAQGSASGKMVEFTPGGASADGSSRMVRVVTGHADPLEPSRFRNRKLPARPPSPPAPVLHAPPKPITEEERRAWDVPVAVKGWTNSAGFTVSLDKRVAFNRPRQERGGAGEVNAKGFAALAETLVAAERAAREGVAARAAVRRRADEAKREEHEARMRDLAARAREDRSTGAAAASAPAGAGPSAPAAPQAPQESSSSSSSSSSVHARREASPPAAKRGGGGDEASYGSDGGYYSTDEEDRRARGERDAMREQRKREREAEARGSNKRARAADTDADAQRERDVSERVALGLGVGAGATSAESSSAFDQRLFGRTGGIASGYGDDETHNPYDKPLFHQRTSDILYHRVGAGGDAADNRDAERLVDDLKEMGEAGAATFSGAGKGRSRSGRGPVEFERNPDDGPARSSNH